MKGWIENYDREEQRRIANKFRVAQQRPHLTESLAKNQRAPSRRAYKAIRIRGKILSPSGSVSLGDQIRKQLVSRATAIALEKEQTMRIWRPDTGWVTLTVEEARKQLNNEKIKSYFARMAAKSKP